MSMNEKVIVGETFDDLSDQEMAMLTGRGTVFVLADRVHHGDDRFRHCRRSFSC